MNQQQKRQPKKPSEDKNTRRAGGAIGGAILGASLGGPVGAVIGGIVGLVLAENVNEGNRKKGGK